jgi:hypothetical protein
MKPEHNELLHDLLDGNDAAGQRSAILHAGGRVLRRRRQLRYLTRAVAGAALVALVLLAIRPITTPRAPALAAKPQPATQQSVRATARLQEITDDELLALFPGTPVGLAKVNGKQRLIFPRPNDEARFVVRL